ncbi:MAG TPA: hypothetical protein V6D17_08985 [Candidatus Obscuribacterales bacterium]
MDSASVRPLANSIALKRLTFGKTTYFELFWIIVGGLPLYLPLVMSLGERGAGANQPIAWAFWANMIVSMPHTWATYARLTRKIGENKVKWYYGFPAYALILAFLCFATVKGFFVEAFTLVNVWQSYHYLRQVYGVSRYFGRSKAESELSQKLSFWGYHLPIPLFVLGRWDLLYTVWRGKPSEYIIPLNIPDPILTFSWILAACGLVSAIASEVIKYRNSDQDYDATGLLNLVMYYFIHWFGFLSAQYYARGFLTITVFHAIQYVGIVFLLEEKQTSSLNFPTRRLLALVPHGLTFLAFWVFLFLIGEGIQDYIFTAPNIFWAQFSATCLSSISAHHYLVDSVMWNRKSGV